MTVFVLFVPLPIILKCCQSAVPKAVRSIALSELTGVPVDKIVAIGDYFNDLEMVQNADLGHGCECAGRAKTGG